MKKIFALLMCVCLVFSLAACSEPKPDSSQGTPASASTSEPASTSDTSESAATSKPVDSQTGEDPDSQPESISQPGDESQSSEDATQSESGETSTDPTQETVSFEFKEIKVEGWETKETNTSPENQYIKVTLAKNDIYADIYKGAVKENLPSLEDAFTDGSGEGTFDDTITVTLGRMGGIYTYAAWESDGFFYVIDNPSGMTPDEINTFMEAIMY